VRRAFRLSVTAVLRVRESRRDPLRSSSWPQDPSDLEPVREYQNKGEMLIVPFRNCYPWSWSRPFIPPYFWNAPPIL